MSHLHELFTMIIDVNTTKTIEKPFFIEITSGVRAELMTHSLAVFTELVLEKWKFLGVNRNAEAEELAIKYSRRILNEIMEIKLFFRNCPEFYAEAFCHFFGELLLKPDGFFGEEAEKKFSDLKKWVCGLHPYYEGKYRLRNDVANN